MALEIVESALKSRTVRKAVGQRVMSVIKTHEEKDERGGFLGRIWNVLKSFWGFLWSITIGSAFRNINFSALWSAIVGGARFLLTFNFNITDDELDKQAKQYELAIAAQLGSTVGGALGYLVCGVVPAASLLVVNEALGALALKNVAEEGLEEFAANLAGLMQVTFRAMAFKLFSNTYKNTRKWLKKPNNLVAQIMFGENYAAVMENWGKPGSKPFVISQIVEERIEQIPNERLRVFTENLLEEFLDACIEAGYIVANTVDGFIAAQKLSQKNLLGERRIVEIIPNRELEREKIILVGQEELLKPAIVQSIAHYQLIENRDVGQIVGAPAESIQFARPQPQRLVVQFFSVQQPPWKVNGVLPKTAEYQIPDVPRSRMDWEKIKLACGGANGYMWGRFFARANLSNGRQMAIYGATESEAEQRLTALAALSDAEIWTINVVEEKKAGRRLTQPKLQKEATRMYPGYVTVFVNRVVSVGGRAGQDGLQRKESSHRFNLWTPTKPSDFEQEIAELFSGVTV